MAETQTSTPQPAAEAARKPLRTVVGVVTSDKGAKSITVVVNYQSKHAKYGKYLKRRTVLQAHDEKNEAKLGDRVSIAETKPLSRLKRWRVLSIVESAVTETGVAISEKDVAEAVPTKTKNVKA